MEEQSDVMQPDAEPGEDELGEDVIAGEALDEDISDSVDVAIEDESVVESEPDVSDVPEELPLDLEPIQPTDEKTAQGAASGGSAEADAEESVQAEELSDDQLRAIIEVLLLVSDKPLSVAKMKEVIEGVNAKKIEEIIDLIRQRLTDHAFPYQIREVGGGYVLSTLSDYAPWVRRFYAPKVKASKLSQAALETLAVVAYKQPVTRAEVEAIRGVNVDSTLKTLLEKRLVEIVGYKDVIGKPATYGTTSEFLLQFGLKSLNDLPSIEELRRMNAEQ